MPLVICVLITLLLQHAFWHRELFLEILCTANVILLLHKHLVVVAFLHASCLEICNVPACVLCFFAYFVYMAAVIVHEVCSCL